jgi:ribonucleotide monophosphatase NagD (HAD superfamily)
LVINYFYYLITFFVFYTAIVLLGEPIKWESSLQVITDLLLTDGNPAVVPIDTTDGHDHIPVIACNRDLVFKAAADLPRFGHGAFLTCLEALYKVNNLFS